jgi:hypothetical protein
MSDRPMLCMSVDAVSDEVAIGGSDHAVYTLSLSTGEGCSVAVLSVSPVFHPLHAHACVHRAKAAYPVHGQNGSHRVGDVCCARSVVQWEFTACLWWHGLQALPVGSVRCRLKFLVIFV